MNIKAIDLFCGIGGLSYGLQESGIPVVAGIDNDNNCKFGYEFNNKNTFINRDIKDVPGELLNELYGIEKNVIRVLVGCAPCQPFSKLNLNKLKDEQLGPIEKFIQLISELKPEIISMENVSGLLNTEKYPVFEKFLKVLRINNYFVNYGIVDASDYGVPQSRRRLVLLASIFGPIELINKTHPKDKVTVRDAIGHLEKLKAGEISKVDPMHRSRNLTKINLERIKATLHDGGSSYDWPDELQLDCHKKKSGKTYKRSVYGRMWWDKPSPTITTQCIGLGNGRFGHPEQDRAISLREAALLQTFPDNYIFLSEETRFSMAKIAKFIGNAVPVRLGHVIGESIINHIESCEGKIYADGKFFV